MFHHVFLFDNRASGVSIVLHFFFRLIANHVRRLYDSLQVLCKDPLFAILVVKSFKGVLFADGCCAAEDKFRCILGVDHLRALDLERAWGLPTARYSIVYLGFALI